MNVHGSFTTLNKKSCLVAAHFFYPSVLIKTVITAENKFSISFKKFIILPPFIKKPTEVLFLQWINSIILS